MSPDRRVLVAAVSMLLTPASVWLVYRLLEGHGWAPLIASLSLSAFVTGLLLGKLFGRRSLLVSGVGALLAVSLMSVPVLLATYGLAVIASPALLAYAGVVAAGVLVGSRTMHGASQ